MYILFKHQTCSMHTLYIIINIVHVSHAQQCLSVKNSFISLIASRDFRINKASYYLFSNLLRDSEFWKLHIGRQSGSMHCTLHVPCSTVFYEGLFLKTQFAENPLENTHTHNSITKTKNILHSITVNHEAHLQFFSIQQPPQTCSKMPRFTQHTDISKRYKVYLRFECNTLTENSIFAILFTILRIQLIIIRTLNVV